VQANETHLTKYGMLNIVI